MEVRIRWNSEEPRVSGDLGGGGGPGVRQSVHHMTRDGEWVVCRRSRRLGNTPAWEAEPEQVKSTGASAPMSANASANVTGAGNNLSSSILIIDLDHDDDDDVQESSPRSFAQARSSSRRNRIPSEDLELRLGPHPTGPIATNWRGGGRAAPAASRTAAPARTSLRIAQAQDINIQAFSGSVRNEANGTEIIRGDGSNGPELFRRDSHSHAEMYRAISEDSSRLFHGFQELASEQLPTLNVRQNPMRHAAGSLSQVPDGTITAFSGSHPLQETHLNLSYLGRQLGAVLSQTADTIDLTNPSSDDCVIISDTANHDISRKRKRGSSAISAEAGKEPKLKCVICMDIMKEETSTICGHIFCKECIYGAIKVQKKCPTCRKKLTFNLIHRIYI